MIICMYSIYIYTRHLYLWSLFFDKPFSTWPPAFAARGAGGIFSAGCCRRVSG